MRKQIFLFCFLLSTLAPTFILAQCNATIGSNPNPITGCEPLTVQFNDSSAGAVQQRTWNFGDGTPTLGTQNPLHTYSAGVGDTSYTVSLSIQCTNGGPSTTNATVTVFAKPKVSFSANKTTVCAITDSVCFINASSVGAGTTFLWTFGDNTTSTQQNPCHKYNTGGTYDVGLTVTNAKGCAKTFTQTSYISVISAPNPDFTLNPFTGCAPLNTIITNTTDTVSNTIASWVWDFGDASGTSTVKNPGSHNYPLAGNYTLTLTSTNTLGCTNKTNQVLVVNTSPVAALSGNPASICAEQSAVVTYTGTSPGATTYSWNFSGGVAVPGSGIGPQTITWANGGIKTVTVEANNNGCKSTAQVQVIVYPKPPVTLTSVNDSVCQGTGLSFIALPNLYPNYQYFVNNVSVQNGTSNVFSPTSLNNNDVVNVVVTDYNGCNSNGFDTLRVTILPNPVVTLSANPSGIICSTDSIVFTASPSGLSSYDFYDGNTLVQTGSSNKFVYKNPVNGHSINVVGSNGNCKGQASAPFVVNVKDPLPKPQVNCGQSTANSVQFAWASITGATGYVVSVNGGAFATPSSGNSGTTHTVSGLNPSDTVKIRVIALGSAPCGNSDTSDIAICTAINCNPITFNYTPSYSVCKGSSVTLNVSNISVANFSTSWAGNAPGKTTSYTFTPTADTTVTLLIKDSTSQATCPSAKVVFDIKVITIPVVSLGADNDSICANDQITFTATPATYDNYDFYDGPQLLQSGALNTYTANTWTSSHTITVIASMKQCSSAVSNAVPVFVQTPLPAPIVNCGNTTTSSIQFTWSSVTGAQGYQVSINGGSFVTPSSGNNGTTHSVSGLTPDTSLTIIVIALGKLPCGNSTLSLPASCFTASCSSMNFNLPSNQNICIGDSTTISVTNINVSNYELMWNSGAATTATSMVFKPTQTQVVSVRMVDKDNPQCPAIVKYMTITVNQKPTVTITSAADTICEGDVITFTAAPVGYTSYEFFDGFYSLQNTAANFYSSSSWIDGHSITCVATNNGCPGTISVPVKITVLKKLNTPQVNCGTSTNNSISFTWDTIPGASGYQVSVNGGNFITPSGSLTHLISGLNPGDSASISVIALGNGPCGNSSASAPFKCYATPCTPVTFSVNSFQSVCSGDTLTLSVTNISAGNFTINWNNGANTTVTTYTVNPTGNVTIPVKVTDNTQAGCKATTKNFVITALPLPSVTLTSNATNDSLCQGVPITFKSIPGNYTNYDFYKNSSLIQSGANPNLTIANLLAGDVIQVKTTNTGCKSQSATKTITIVPAPTVSITSSDPNDTICFGQSITFTGAPTGLINYEFFSGSVSLQSGSGIGYTSTTLPAGVNNITVVGTNNLGCNGTSSIKKITVLAVPGVALTSNVSGSTICKDQKVLFTATPTGAAAYQFYNGNAVLQNGTSNTYTTTQLSTTDTITVFIVGQNGCSSSESAPYNFTVKPSARPTVTDSVTGVCKGSSATLSASVDPQYTPVTYSWSNGATTQSISVSPTSATMYYVTTTYQGCASAQDSTLVKVDLLPVPVGVVRNDTTICRGDSVSLFASGGLNYNWTPSPEISNPLISNPKAAPKTTTTYTVIVSNDYCFDQKKVQIYIDKCLTDLPELPSQVITPNNDGDNDTWIVTDLDYFTKNKLIIFNRWGQVVFEAAPYLNDWTGKNSSGTDLADGTYFYVLDLGNGKPEKKGFIIIHR